MPKTVTLRWDEEPVEWKLLTDIPVNSKAATIEKLNWYASRWKIETLSLEAGCKTEA
jgi:hypothetical protein